MEKSHYEKLLTDNITERSNNKAYNSINLEAKYIARKLKQKTELNVWPENQSK